MPDDTLMRSADVMANTLKDPGKVDEIKANPARVDAIAKDAKDVTDATFRLSQRATALDADRVVYRMTTIFLGTAVLVIAVGIIVIRLAPVIFRVDLTPANAAAFSIPESLVAIASTAVGALAGLLSPLGTRSG